MAVRSKKRLRKNQPVAVPRHWVAPVAVAFGLCALLAVGVFGYRELSQP